jgi:hypothetical protein
MIADDGDAVVPDPYAPDRKHFPPVQCQLKPPGAAATAAAPHSNISPADEEKRVTINMSRLSLGEFVRSPRVQGMHFCSVRKAYGTTIASGIQIHYGGVHERIRKRLFPRFCWKTHARTARRVSAGGTHDIKRSGRAQKFSTGKDVGSRVDTEMGMFSAGIPLTSPHTATTEMIRWLSMRELVPIAAQVPIYDEELQIATACDIMAYSLKTGTKAMIEMKVGYETGIDVAQGDMEPPFGHVPNSPLNQHWMQIRTMKLIMDRKYPGRADTYLLVVVNNRGVTAHEPPDWFWAPDDDVLFGVLAAPIR